MEKTNFLLNDFTQKKLKPKHRKTPQNKKDTRTKNTKFKIYNEVHKDVLLNNKNKPQIKINIKIFLELHKFHS